MSRWGRFVIQWWMLLTVAACTVLRYVVGGPVVVLVGNVIIWTIVGVSWIGSVKSWRAWRARRRAQRAHKLLRDQLVEQRLMSFAVDYASGNLPAKNLHDFLVMYETLQQHPELETGYGSLLFGVMAQSVWLPE